jgi:hypothetical protein
MRKEGKRLGVEPAPRKSLLAFFGGAGNAFQGLPPISDMPRDPLDL